MKIAVFAEINCVKKKKFGGDGSCRKSCIRRQCLSLISPIASDDDAAPFVTPTYASSPFDEVCIVCSNGDSNDGNELLLCDGKNCKICCHLKCHRPQLSAVPDGKWLCEGCANSTIPSQEPVPPLTGSSSVEVQNFPIGPRRLVQNEQEIVQRSTIDSSNERAEKGSLVDKKNAIATELDLTGSIPNVAKEAASILGLESECVIVNLPSQIDLCYNALFKVKEDKSSHRL